MNYFQSNSLNTAYEIKNKGWVVRWGCGGEWLTARVPIKGQKGATEGVKERESVCGGGLGQLHWGCFLISKTWNKPGREIVVA